MDRKEIAQRVSDQIGKELASEPNTIDEWCESIERILDSYKPLYLAHPKGDPISKSDGEAIDIAWYNNVFGVPSDEAVNSFARTLPSNPNIPFPDIDSDMIEAKSGDYIETPKFEMHPYPAPKFDITGIEAQDKVAHMTPSPPPAPSSDEVRRIEFPKVQEALLAAFYGKSRTKDQIIAQLPPPISTRRARTNRDGIWFDDFAHVTIPSGSEITILPDIPIGLAGCVYFSSPLLKTPKVIDKNHFDFIDEDIPATQSRHKCHCDITTLMSTGCNCGGD